MCVPYPRLSRSLSVIIIKVNCGSRVPDEEYNISISDSASHLPSLPLQLHTIITTLSQQIAHTMDHSGEGPTTLKFLFFCFISFTSILPQCAFTTNWAITRIRSVFYNNKKMSSI